MEFFFYIFMFMLSSGSWAKSEISYEKYDLAPVNLEHSSRLASVLVDEGFISMAEDSYGLPSLGINQVYFKDENQFVMVKYGLQGEFPLNEILPTKTGYLVHQKYKDESLFVFFHGMHESRVRLMLGKMNAKMTSQFFRPLKNLIIPEAHAQEDCNAQAMIGQMRDFSQLSAAMVWNFSKNCVTGLGSGVMSAGNGVVQSTQSLWNAVRNPIEFVDSTANTVRDFISGVATFTRGLMTDATGTLNRLGSRLGGAWSNMTTVVAGMSTDLKVQFICSLVGSLGITGAIAVFTGVGIARFATQLVSIASKMNLATKMMSVLSRLNATQKAAIGLGSDKIKNFMNRIMRGGISNDDLIHLDDMTNMNPAVGTRVLSCFI